MATPRPVRTPHATLPCPLSAFAVLQGRACANSHFFLCRVDSEVQLARQVTAARALDHGQHHGAMSATIIRAWLPPTAAAMSATIIRAWLTPTAGGILPCDHQRLACPYGCCRQDHRGQYGGMMGQKEAGATNEDLGHCGMQNIDSPPCHPCEVKVAALSHVRSDHILKLMLV